MFPAPYIMARMCEFNAQAFDEEDFEFGPDGDDNFILLRKDKGVKNAVEDVDDDVQDQDSYWWMIQQKLFIYCFILKKSNIHTNGSLVDWWRNLIAWDIAKTITKKVKGNSKIITKQKSYINWTINKKLNAYYDSSNGWVY